MELFFSWFRIEPYRNRQKDRKVKRRTLFLVRLTFLLLLILLFANEVWATPCSENFAEVIEKVPLSRSLIERHRSWFENLDENSQKRLLSALRTAPDVPRTRRLLNRLLPMREGQLKAVLEVLANENVDDLMKRAVGGPRPLNQAELRALNLMLHENWWYNSRLETLQVLTQAFEKRKPSFYFRKLAEIEGWTSVRTQLDQILSNPGEPIKILLEEAKRIRDPQKILTALKLRKKLLTKELNELGGKFGSGKVKYHLDTVQFLIRSIETAAADPSEIQSFLKQSRKSRWIYDRLPSVFSSGENLVVDSVLLGLISVAVIQNLQEQGNLSHGKNEPSLGTDPELDGIRRPERTKCELARDQVDRAFNSNTISLTERQERLRTLKRNCSL